MALLRYCAQAGGEANHLLRHGPHSAGERETGSIFTANRTGISPAFRTATGAAMEVPPEVVSPRGGGALMEPGWEEFCREQGICMDLQENFRFLREFPNKLEERQMKLW